MDSNSGYCGDSSKFWRVGHTLNIFSGISLLVVINLSFVTKKFPSGEESLLVLWDVLSVLCYEKLFRIVLLFVYGLTFISYFC